MVRRRWARLPPPRATVALPAPLPGCTPADQVRRLTCALCRREAKGFGYVHELRLGSHPKLSFCSMRCCEGGSALARRSGGVIDKTMPIHQSNVAIFNAATGKADRVGARILADGKKVRVYKSSGEEIKA
jgi:hypothetical protein